MAETAIVRVCRADGSAAGTGFLVTPRLVLTCAHVVDGDVVRVEFPLLERPDEEPVAATEAEVVSLRPAREDDTGDTALLAIRELPRGARPVTLAADSGKWDDELRIFGFPLPFAHGVWVSGRLKSRQGAGWKQMESDPGHPGIAPGFSGSPVWSGNVVIGMTVAAHNEPDATTAYMVPVEALKEAHPEITVPAKNPYRGLEPFLEEHADIFYGRSDAIERLTEAVRTRPVVVVSGPSGSGKSSLVLAGLLPRLNNKVVRFRPDPVLRPAAMLAAVLVPVLEPGLSEVDMLVEKEKLAALLTEPSPDLIALLAQRLDGLLVFADQFEEIAASDPDAARTLFGLLIALAPALKTVLTLRSASLDELLTETTAETLDHGVMLLPPMSRSELYAAVTGPVTPGAFEPGLVERVLDDAGHNRLPLVQFALTQLWEGGALTHAAYDELGGVSGALVTYAEDCYLKLTEQEQADARRLFIQLAVPEEDGFARKPARIADLGPDLKPTLAKLAAYRLIVLDHAVDGAEIADIVHQALIQRWDRLRGWLTDDREFRSWQEQLRHRLDEPTHDLLRGTTLARAQHWLTERPHDIPTPHQKFIHDSISRQRREVRTWRMITAVIAVLALVAGTLGVIAWQSNLDNERQLHIQASHLLGQESRRQAATDPLAALQLALSAWHNDTKTSEAYDALLNQSLAMGSVTRIDRDILLGAIGNWTATPDGRVIATLTGDTNGHHKLTIWQGLFDGNPTEWHVDVPSLAEAVALSPDGSWISVASRKNGLWLWHNENRTASATVLRPEAELAGLARPALSFSADGQRLLEQRMVSQEEPEIIAAVWDLAGRKTISTLNVPAEKGYLALGPEPGTLILSRQTGPAVIDAVTGAEIRQLPTGAVISNAARVVACDPSNGLRVADVKTGKEQWALPIQTCGLTETDATGRYLINKSYIPSGGFQLVALTDTTNGRRYQVRIPQGAGVTSSLSPQFVVADHQDGSVTVLVPIGRTILTLRGVVPAMTFDDADVVSPDGRYGLAMSPESPTISVVDLGTGAELARRSGMRTSGNWYTFTADNRYLVAVQDDGLEVFSLPGLTEVHRIAAREYSQERACEPRLLATRASEIFVGCGFRIYRWDVETGTALGEPLMRDAPVAVRPGHPSQIFTARDDKVELTELDEDEGIPLTIGGIAAPAVPDPTGARLAVYTSSQTIEIWDLETRKMAYVPIKLSDKVGRILGFGPDDTLLTQLDDVVKVWKFRDGALFATARLPDSAQARLNGDTLTYYGGNGPFSIKLDPAKWFSDLCRVADRDITPDEERLYPTGALKDRPCQ